MNSLKRPGAALASEAKRSPWQQPASCKFCRTKKIRCDKKRPCSSCTARGVTCEYDSAVEDSVLLEGEYGGYAQVHPSTVRSLERGMYEMNERLKRMEQLLHRNSSYQSPADLSSLPSIDSYPPLDLSREHVSKTWEHLEYMAASPRIDNSSPHDQSFDPSVTRESTSAPTKIALRAEKDLIRILPPIDVARQLFEHYVEAVDCMDRFIHVPSTRDLLEATYAGLPSSVPARETLIFFVCIFASGSYYVCRVHDHRVTDQLSREHARSAAWVERALHEVMRPDTMYSSSVMSLQSSFIVLLLLLDFEGQSKRYHVLKSIIHTRAIQMKLHKTDMEAQEKDLDFIEAEIKRRLWWYLVGTDWLHGNVAGPQEGTYTINPQHMATELPGNIDDKNLSTDVPPVSRELHQPTSMSFFLQRIEVAKLSRESVDLLQNIGSSISSSYPLILRVTEKYTSLLSSLPPFFQSHNEDFSSQEVISRDRPYISRQRAILLYGLYSRLGRLHRPFMTLGITDKTFEISHQMGIHCAKMILELRNSMAEEDMCLFGRSHSVDQHSFIALVLLSIDIIARPDQEGVEAQRSEIMNTCRTLINKYQPGGQSSGGITRAIELLLDILHKSKQSTLVPGAFASPTRPTPRSASREFPTTANIQPEDAMASLDTPNQVSWLDGLSFPSLPGQEIHDLFDELRTTVSGAGYFSWEDFFDWQGLC